MKSWASREVEIEWKLKLRTFATPNQLLKDLAILSPIVFLRLAGIVSFEAIIKFIR